MSGAYYDPDDHCTCLAFLAWDEDWDVNGRIERYPDCPRHWRFFEGEYSIPRESEPVQPDDFLALARS